MKLFFVIFAATSVMLAFRANAQDTSDYRVLKICESDYALHTSDGADAGRIEYIVIDPQEDEIVSAIVTGGIEANRFVTLPFSVFHLGTSHDVVLREVDRAHLESAPVIERSRITTSAAFDRGLVERSYTHFGMDVHRRWEGRDRGDRKVRGTTSADSPPRSNRGSTTSENTRDADRRRADEEAARRGESNTRDTAASQARGRDKNAATSQEEKNRMERERQGQGPNASSTSSRERNAASTAKEDALTSKRDQADKEKANQEKANKEKENTPPEQRNANAKGKEDSPPERTKGDRNAAKSETHRNPESRPEEKKNSSQSEPGAAEKNSPESKSAEEKSKEKESSAAAKRESSATTSKAAESKEKEKNPRANAGEAGQRRGEEKSKKQGEKEKPEDETPKRKPQS
jgi:hypothetical protein